MNPIDAIIETLGTFWDKGIKKVSPEALGMAFQGHPFSAADMDTFVDMLTFAVWRDGWIILKRDPRGI